MSAVLMGEICRLDFSCGQPFLSPYFFFKKYIIPPLAPERAPAPRSNVFDDGRSRVDHLLCCSRREGYLLYVYRPIMTRYYRGVERNLWVSILSWKTKKVGSLKCCGCAITGDRRGHYSRWYSFTVVTAAHLLGLAPFFHQSLFIHGKQRLLYLEQ